MTVARENGRGAEPAGTVAATSLPSSLDHKVLRRNALECWGAAFSLGDDAEVDRLVRQSHDDSDATPALGLIGARRLQTNRLGPPAESVTSTRRAPTSAVGSAT